MIVTLDPNNVEDYRKFLAIKSLPRYRVVGNRATIPDEYASRIGLTDVKKSESKYVPYPGLFDYQRDLAAMAIRKKRFAIFAEPGLGKTFMMTEWARHAHQQIDGKAVLLISPLMVCEQTVDEAKQFYGNQVKIEPVPANKLASWMRSSSGIGITNFEAISDEIQEIGNVGAIGIDESHTINSHYGKWGTRIIHLGKGLEWKLACTGTPAPNDPIEYGNHALFLDQFPTLNAFLARYFVNRGATANRWELKPHAKAKFYRDLSYWSFFLSRPGFYGWKDNIKPLPPIHVEILDVPLTPDQVAKASQLNGGLFPSSAGGIVKRSQLSRIAKGIDAESIKPQFVTDLTRDAAQKGGVLVWCKYNAEQDRLARMMPEAGNIEGSTPTDIRRKLISEFQSGERKILISKGKILGLGLNLQIARTHVWSTIEDSYSLWFQGIKRSNRYGSLHDLRVLVPLTELERPMFDTVLRKANRVRQEIEEQEALFKEFGFVS